MSAPMTDYSRTATDESYEVDTDIQANTALQPERAHLQLAIDGMSCQACASRIEKVLNKKDEVYKVNVNFAGETATTFSARAGTPSGIKAPIQRPIGGSTTSCMSE